MFEEADAGLEAAPSEPGLLFVRGACRAELGDGELAEVDLRRVLVVDPDDPDVRFVLGALLAREGRQAEAIPLLDEQVRRTPDRADALAALGLAHYELGHLDLAIGMLEPFAWAGPRRGFRAPGYRRAADARRGAGAARPRPPRSGGGERSHPVGPINPGARTRWPR